jgi:hypothetical protein
MREAILGMNRRIANSISLETLCEDLDFFDEATTNLIKEIWASDYQKLYVRVQETRKKMRNGPACFAPAQLDDVRGVEAGEGDYQSTGE